MSDERARTINTLRDLALALHNDQQAQAQEMLDAISFAAENGRPSATQVSIVAMESLDAWYSHHQLQNGAVHVVQREVPRAMQDVTTAMNALASKGRALRSADSLLQRNPERAVAGAGAYLTTAAVRALATLRGDSFEATMDELLPAQQVSEPHDEIAEVVDETVELDHASADDPQARYTAIVETRFMAGVKEFFQWVGASHGVTGTGLPKRADIQDVSATIGIAAEGVAKKPAAEQPVASDLDLSVPAVSRPVRYVTSAQAIPELMAFWIALHQTKLVEINSTKIQLVKGAPSFGFEDFDQLEAAEELVAAYVHQTLTVDVDDDAAAATAAFLLDANTIDNPQTVLIPRLRQLESVGLIDIVDGVPAIPAALRPAVTAGASRVTA